MIQQGHKREYCIKDDKDTKNIAKNHQYVYFTFSSIYLNQDSNN